MYLHDTIWHSKRKGRSHRRPKNATSPHTLKDLGQQLRLGAGFKNGNHSGYLWLETQLRGHALAVTKGLRPNGHPEGGYGYHHTCQAERQRFHETQMRSRHDRIQQRAPGM